jgi:Flp pilus assembly protein TadD/ketosteroid isomerase-like protein
MLSFLSRTFQHQLLQSAHRALTFLFNLKAARRWVFIALALLLANLLANSPAWADEFADISKFIRAGQFNEALAKVDAALAQRPKDAQMRFLKGLIYTEQNKTADAIVVFTKMTEEFPELPEPFNNLAVLYASGGQYDKARVALEAAIRTHPAYATAYENLGDVYAKLASQSYDKALQADSFVKLANQAYDKAIQLDSNNAVTRKKLAMLNSIGSGKNATPAQIAANNSKTTTAKPSVASTPTPAPIPTPSPAPIQIAKAETKSIEASAPIAPAVKSENKPETKPETKQEAKPETKPAIKPEAEAKAKDETKTDKGRAKPDTKADAKAETEGAQEDALNALQAWAKAWSSKDVKTYLNSYANDFQTPKGESRKAWAEERRSRIEGKGRITVQIEVPQVSIEDNTATIKFRQLYKSDKLSANSRKVIVLVKQGGKWLIKQERSAS